MTGTWRVEYLGWISLIVYYNYIATRPLNLQIPSDILFVPVLTYPFTADRYRISLETQLSSKFIGYKIVISYYKLTNIFRFCDVSKPRDDYRIPSKFYRRPRSNATGTHDQSPNDDQVPGTDHVASKFHEILRWDAYRSIVIEQIFVCDIDIITGNWHIVYCKFRPCEFMSRSSPEYFINDNSPYS